MIENVEFGRLLRIVYSTWSSNFKDLIQKYSLRTLWVWTQLFKHLFNIVVWLHIHDTAVKYSQNVLFICVLFNLFSVCSCFSDDSLVHPEIIHFHHTLHCTRYLVVCNSHIVLLEPIHIANLFYSSYDTHSRSSWKWLTEPLNSKHSS